MILTENKKALHDYHILETLEAGLVLSGAEVKSVKKGQVNPRGSYINIISQSEAQLIGAHISPYKPASTHQRHYKPSQDRQLLLHKKQLKYLYGKSKEKGLTIIPTKIYLKNNSPVCAMMEIKVPGAVPSESKLLQSVVILGLASHGASTGI